MSDDLALVKPDQVFTPWNHIHTKIAMWIVHWDDHKLSVALDLIHLTGHGASIFEDKRALGGILRRGERNGVRWRAIELGEDSSEPADCTLVIRASHTLVMVPSAVLHTGYQSVWEDGFPIVVRGNWPGNTEGIDCDHAADFAWG